MALVENPLPLKYGGVQLDAVRCSRAVHAAGTRACGLALRRACRWRVAQAFAACRSTRRVRASRRLLPCADRSTPRQRAGLGGSGHFDDIGTPASYLATCLRMADGDPARLIESGAAGRTPAPRLSRHGLLAGRGIEDDVELDVVHRVQRRARAPRLTVSSLGAAAGRAPCPLDRTTIGTVALTVTPIDLSRPTASRASHARKDAPCRPPRNDAPTPRRSGTGSRRTCCAAG